MKSGLYRMLFSADGHTSDGRMTVDRGFVVGGDGSYVVSGQVAEAGHNLIGTLDVTLAPGMSPNRKIAEAFELNVQGKDDDSGFSLIGTGPLGIIIEITCRIDDPAIQAGATP